jgi:hypothetical protein
MSWTFSALQNGSSKSTADIMPMTTPRGVIANDSSGSKKRVTASCGFGIPIAGDLTAVLERIYVELYGSGEAEIVPSKHQRHR